MRRYRLELVCESGADEPEETVLRTSTDAARLLAPIFEGADREKFVAFGTPEKSGDTESLRKAS